jgi:diguanylate cyclase (GGDEF)-like protein/PAS domain S-box-containing protein
MDAEENEGQDAPLSSEHTLKQLLLALTAILEGLPDAVVIAAPDGHIMFINAQAEELFGYPRWELVGEPVQTLWPERLRVRYTNNMQRYFASQHPMRFSTEAWGIRRDRSEFAGEMNWGVVGTPGGPLLLAVGRDISVRRTREARLRAVAAMGDRALAGAGPAELAADASELMRTSLPLVGAQVRLEGGISLASFGSVEHADIRVPIGTGDELIVAAKRKLDDEELLLVRAVANVLATAFTRLRGEERMRYEAVHDPLTGLANRTLLRDRLEHAIARSERSGDETAVLFVDLDDFKRINDEYGHAAGDSVLVEIGERLRNAVRPGDTIARLGGDEFVVVCEEISVASARAVAARLQDAFHEPIPIGERRHRMSASIGIALGHSDPDELIGNADAAVYKAKAAGRGGVKVFS